MTVTELIEILKEFPVGEPVWVMGGADCDTPCDPAPELVTNAIDRRGVYL